MADGGLDRPKVESIAYRRAVLAVLMVVFIFNFIDRSIIGIIGLAIKEDLGLTDTQLGLLQGLAFALLYTLAGIPIARWAERSNRVSIIALSLVVWSGFTVLCGLAQNFYQLLLLRMGVGIGEAGCSPAANSIIADYFPPDRRASAISVIALGIPVGVMVGSIAGGWITQTFSWREAFFLVGLPGIGLAVFVKWFIREPLRGQYDHAYLRSAVVEVPSIRAVASRLFATVAFRHVMAGITLAALASYAVSSFIAPFFIRVFGLNFAQAGLAVGLVVGASHGAGTLIGGFLADWAGRRNAAWYALLPGLGLIIAAPLYIVVFAAPTWLSAALVALVPGALHSMYLPPSYGVMHNLLEPRMRATGTAIVTFILSLVAAGLGPLLMGIVIDLLAAQNFDADGLDFRTSCGPTGTAALADIREACRLAVVDGTRYGLMATSLIFAWAGVHFLLASRGLAQALRNAREHGDAGAAVAANASAA